VAQNVTILVLILAFCPWTVARSRVSVLGHSVSHVSQSGTTPTAATPQGLDLLKPLIDWLTKVPKAFEAFVSGEERAQLFRQMRDMATALARINIDCITLAALTEHSRGNDGSLDKDFDRLRDSIFELQGRWLTLATDLGGEWGKEGSAMAWRLAYYSDTRAGVVMDAHIEMFRGEHVEAAKKLREAGTLAAEANRVVIGFLQTPVTR
jgi:hypothetical protein